MEKQNRFDELMLGKKQEAEPEETEEKAENSFDLFQTVELLNDTYQKLSPLKNIFKNIKK
ncbi:hypothetical protein SAMN04487943_101209 [Gracilibacillus orientalis]|uniref:Uncharacterized protein n=1 Tax=Gracilibacillus orientalis TaxID=334253 RepID=A0A1I4H5Q9_9BACI|nr:hypothetical protein [Gracilibacillus orientalis]SFL36967.1 hypothetical protein SAMN04487943_101209 [Gracilibacillus orientalis]